jgi:hypothetical protein
MIVSGEIVRGGGRREWRESEIDFERKSRDRCKGGGEI